MRCVFCALGHAGPIIDLEILSALPLAAVLCSDLPNILTLPVWRLITSSGFNISNRERIQTARAAGSKS